jgi:hypothetical protein
MGPGKALAQGLVAGPLGPCPWFFADPTSAGLDSKFPNAYKDADQSVAVAHIYKELDPFV